MKKGEGDNGDKQRLVKNILEPLLRFWSDDDELMLFAADFVVVDVVVDCVVEKKEKFLDFSIEKRKNVVVELVDLKEKCWLKHSKSKKLLHSFSKEKEEEEKRSIQSFPELMKNRSCFCSN